MTSTVRGIGTFTPRPLPTSKPSDHEYVHLQ
jgi:hypothetical protein